MTMTDEEFREAYKSIQVPSHYEQADTQENKIIFALAQVGEGSAAAILAELEKLEPGISGEQLAEITSTVLTNLYEKGLLTGTEKDGVMIYNLHKVTEANAGSINPDLLAPGLD